MNIRINSVRYNNSLVDGPGIRTIVFMQGCDLRCKGCQNPSTWSIDGGKVTTVESLVEELNGFSKNKKVTISGGEPLVQKEAVSELIRSLFENGYDIALYTGHKKDDVPVELLKYLRYLKTGEFIEKLKTGTKPFIGSSNQIFEEINHETVK